MKPKVNFKSGIEEMLLNIEDWKMHHYGIQKNQKGNKILV